jgi:GTP-binding protein Era
VTVTTRSGFVALVGRPNAGKSTLVNRIVGDKVAIVSDKPQTTRREIRGIATGEDWQLVLADLPGMQKPRDPLTERMQRQVVASLRDADAVLFLLNGEQMVRDRGAAGQAGRLRAGPGDRFIAAAARRARVPAAMALNKVDRLNRARTAAALTEAARLGVPGELFPISARTGEGVPELVEHLVTLVPEGPFLYPPEDRSDQRLETRIAELVREQVLLRTREELPHAVEVEVDELERRDDGLIVIRALVWAETESQKGILVGAGGSMIKAVGTAARKEIELLVGGRVHLDLRVRVRRGWRKDEGLLDRLGIE